jgi:small redox-active disulfide protein 2
MRIQSVGIGCPNCQTTERNVFNACTELDIAADISHVREARLFPAMGVVATPAVVVDGKVVISGRVPTVAELKRILNP